MSLKTCSFILFFFITFFTSKTYSQHIFISGLVFEKINHIPLQYATVSLHQLPDSQLISGTITNYKGEFAFKNIQGNSFYICSEYIGFEKNTIKIDLSGKQNYLVDTIFLNNKSIDLEAVEISGEKRRIEFQMDKKIVNVSNDLNISGGTAVDALENVPSVEVDFEGKVKLRGSSSFTVLVDGVQSPLSSTDALNQIPAITIDKIEVITNPSAKYDPSGTSGIINVILKKNKNEGMNGLLELSAGLNEKYNSNFSLNYKKKKLSLNTNINWNDSRYINNIISERNFYLLGDTNNFYNTKKNITNYSQTTYKIGANYQISQKRSIQMDHTYTLRYRKSTSDIFENQNNNQSLYYNFYDVLKKGNHDNYQMSLVYNENFKRKGQNIKIDGNFNIRNDKNTGDESIFSSDELQNILSNPNKKSIDYFKTDYIGYRLKADYSHPLKKENYQINAGIHQWYNETKEIFTLDELNINTGALNRNLLFNRIFNFYQYTLASYGEFSGKIKNFSYKLGTRIEYTDRIISIKNSNKPLHFARWDIYPTLHLSQKLPKDFNIQASYSRKVHRPFPDALSSDTIYVSRYQRAVGNALLIPEFTDSYQFTLYKPFKNNTYISTELFHKRSNNMIMEYSTALNDSVSISSQDNIAQINSSGIEISSNVEIFKWYSVNGSLTYDYSIYSGDLSGIKINENNGFYYAQIGMDFKMKKDLRFQTGSYYSSPSTWGLQKYGNYIYYYVAIKKDFYNRKFSLNLRAMNFLHRNEFKYETIQANYRESTNWKGEWPYLFLTLTYNFNNYQGPRGNGANMNEGAPMPGGF
jgi:outer membrane receptor protein involved in Fe transport